ncbi:uncharacterized protein TNCV_3238091 [Trichonephila clavipes]|nr:uncharacterized protein TNCV_3238091 [Trichonephila clavipes]
MNKIKKPPAKLDFPIGSSEDYIKVEDDNVCVAPIMADKDIFVSDRSSKNIIHADSDDENDMNDEDPVPTLFEMRKFINDCTTYAQAIAILDSLFIKKRNVIFARHCLSTRNQQTEETVSEYLQILNQLSKDCDFTDVKAEEYRKEYIRDAFIRGLKCPRIRQRLLENTSMTLDQARTLESAEVHAASYIGSSFPVQSAAMKTEDFSEETVATSAASSFSSRSQKCFFCGNDLHSRTLCPARNVTCRNCGKKGHYQRVCKSRPGRNS